jgi:hypothetical protein
VCKTHTLYRAALTYSKSRSFGVYRRLFTREPTLPYPTLPYPALPYDPLRIHTSTRKGVPPRVTFFFFSSSRSYFQLFIFLFFLWCKHERSPRVHSAQIFTYIVVSLALFLKKIKKNAPQVHFRCRQGMWVPPGALHLGAPQVHFSIAHLRCTSSWCTSGAPRVYIRCASGAPRCASGVLRAIRVPPGAPHLGAPQVHLKCALVRLSVLHVHLRCTSVYFMRAPVPPGAPHLGALQVHSPSGSAVHYLQLIEYIDIVAVYLFFPPAKLQGGAVKNSF